MWLLNNETDIKWSFFNEMIVSRSVAPTLFPIASTKRSIPEVFLGLFCEVYSSRSYIFCIHLSVISLNILWRGSLFSQKKIDFYSFLKCVSSLTSEG